MEEIICEIVFVNLDGEIKSRSKYDIKYFNRDRELASKILEGLHYDLLHRMSEEKLIEYKQKLNS